MAKQATTMEDPVFGTFIREAMENAWQRGIEIEHFREFGKELPELPSEDEGEDFQ
jgi:hypothetical protein